MKMPNDHRDRNGEDFRRRKKYAIPAAQWDKLEALAARKRVHVYNLIEALIDAGMITIDAIDSGRELYLSQNPPRDEYGVLLLSPFSPIQFPED